VPDLLVDYMHKLCLNYHCLSIYYRTVVSFQWQYCNSVWAGNCVQM